MMIDARISINNWLGSIIFRTEEMLPVGKWITFEGIGCSGKSTQVETIVKWLRESGFDVVATKEPGGTEVGAELREMVKKPRTQKLQAYTELMIFEADRHETIKQIVQPGIEKGKIVISDRGIDGSIAYQGFGRQMDLNLISGLTQRATEGLEPHLTVFIDISIDTHLARMAQRNSEDEDQFDLEARAFQERVRQGFLHAAEQSPHRVRIVDGALSSEEVTAAIKQIFTEFGVLDHEKQGVTTRSDQT